MCINNVEYPIHNFEEKNFKPERLACLGIIEGQLSPTETPQQYGTDSFKVE